MVSPARLVETLSQVTGFPLASVVDIDRKLVAADLRRKTGRGPHVAQMTALDAARLLTAILGSPQSNTAADAVRRYHATRIDAERSSAGLFASSAGLEDLAGLSADHSFVDGLEALIGSAASGSISAVIADTQRTTEPHIEIFTFTGVTRGRIRISGLSGGHIASVEYALQSGAERAEFSDRRSGDLEQSRRITGRTIYAVAALLRMEAGHDGA